MTLVIEKTHDRPRQRVFADVELTDVLGEIMVSALREGNGLELRLLVDIRRPVWNADGKSKAMKSNA